jgi:CheY-like chemotaxis protein/HPt (histidine-containing phosphotransfer) domain-containing protein
MQGEIGVRSAPGRGSAFWFTVALRPALGEVTPEATSEPAVAPLRILVAEDNAVNAHLVKSILGKAGHAVVHVEDGLKAVAAVRESAFDLVLMDLQMPVMDGFEATTAIRAIEKTTGRRLPIVALTAHAMQGDRDACLAAGMDAYISKPIRTDELIAAIARLTTVALDAPLPREEREPARSPVAAFDPDEALARVEGDLALFAELVQLFRDDLPKRLDDLRRCVECGDARGLERAAHTLKGSVNSFGGGSVSEALAALENLARGGTIGSAPSRVAEIARDVRELERDLVRFCADGAP